VETPFRGKLILGLHVGHVAARHRLPAEPLRHKVSEILSQGSGKCSINGMTHYNWAFEMNHSSDEFWGLLR